MHLVLVIARDLPVSTEIVLDPLCCYFETEILPSWIHHYLPPAIQASILQALDVQDIHVRRLSERCLESLCRTVRDVFRHSDFGDGSHFALVTSRGVPCTYPQGNTTEYRRLYEREHSVWSLLDTDRLTPSIDWIHVISTPLLISTRQWEQLADAIFEPSGNDVQ